MNKLIFIFLISMFSCNSYKIEEEKNRYLVISVLFNELAKPIEPIFPSPYSNKPFTSKDSVKIYKMIEESKEEIRRKKFIVAVDTLFSNTKFNSINLKSVPPEYLHIVNKLLAIKSERELTLIKIRSKRNDSIIPFTKTLLTKGRKEYIKFDYLISFSHVVFDKNYSKSVVIVSGSRSKLAGATILFYLMKVDNKWKIYDAKTLEIS